MERPRMAFMATLTQAGGMILMIGIQPLVMFSYWLMLQYPGACANNALLLKALLKPSTWDLPTLEIKPHGTQCSWRNSDMMSETPSRYMEIIRDQ
jgi:hypothetical protein